MSSRGIECGDLFVGELMGWTLGQWVNVLCIWRHRHLEPLPPPTLANADSIRVFWEETFQTHPQYLGEKEFVLASDMLWIAKVFVETALSLSRPVCA